MQFYKERNGEFVNCVGLAEYTIEHWCENIKVSETFLGYRERPLKRHILDEYLKQNEVQNQNTEQLLLKWQEILKQQKMPDDLKAMTYTACCI